MGPGRDGFCFTNVWGLGWKVWKVRRPGGQLPRYFFTDMSGTVVGITHRSGQMDFFMEAEGSKREHRKVFFKRAKVEADWLLYLASEDTKLPFHPILCIKVVKSWPDPMIGVSKTLRPLKKKNHNYTLVATIFKTALQYCNNFCFQVSAAFSLALSWRLRASLVPPGWHCRPLQEQRQLLHHVDLCVTSMQYRCCG